MTYQLPRHSPVPCCTAGRWKTFFRVVRLHRKMFSILCSFSCPTLSLAVSGLTCYPDSLSICMGPNILGERPSTRRLSLRRLQTQMETLLGREIWAETRCGHSAHGNGILRSTANFRYMKPSNCNSEQSC